MKQVFKLLLACAVGVLPMSVGARDSEACLLYTSDAADE